MEGRQRPADEQESFHVSIQSHSTLMHLNMKDWDNGLHDYKCSLPDDLSKRLYKY